MGLAAYLIVSVIVLLILFYGAFFYVTDKQEKQCRTLVEGWQLQQEMKRSKQIDDLSKDIELFLLSLKLPQFEEQKHRAIVARQLSIALIERLLT